MNNNILGHIVRFIVSAIVLLIVAWFVPGFSLSGFWTALLAAIVIALIGWGIEAMMGDKVSPYRRGFVGFIVSAVVIYLAQFLIAGYRATILGSLLAALIIGIIDGVVPAKPRLAPAQRTDET